MAFYGTPDTARNLGINEFPFSVSLDPHDNSATPEPATCRPAGYFPIWFTYQPIFGDSMMSVVADLVGGIGSYQPYVSVYTGEPGNLTQIQIGSQDFCQQTGGAPQATYLQIPLTPGQRIYIEVQSSSADSATGVVSFTAVMAPRAVAPIGSIVIPSDNDEFPAVIFDPDGNIVQIRDFPAGEFADLLPTGEICTVNGADHKSAIIYDPTTLETIATWDVPGATDSIRGIKSDRTSKFFVVYWSPGGVKVVRLSAAGVEETTWTLPANGADARVFAVNRAGTVLYYGLLQLMGAGIFAYSLQASAALPDLTAGFGSEYLVGAGDGFVLEDGSICFGYASSAIGTDGVVRRFDTAGTVLQSYLTTSGSFTKLHHYAYVDEDKFVAWDNAVAGVGSYFEYVAFADGAISGQFRSPSGSPGSTTSSFSEWGISSSCPVFALTQPMQPLSRASAPAEATCECCDMTKLGIINEALYKIGETQSVESLEESSRQAVLGSTLYDKALREQLRHHPWPFATKYADTADAEAAGDPMELVLGSADEPVNGDWIYAYRYPSDCIFARRILPPGASGNGRQFDENPVPFRVGRTTQFGADDDYLLIFTNQEDAVLEYTALIECREDFFDALFEDALSWRLASKLAPGLTRNKRTADECWRMYILAVDTAAAVAQREGQLEPEGDARWINGR